MKMASIELSHSSDRVRSYNCCHNLIINMLLVIQGTADVSSKLTQAEISKTVDFCLNAFADIAPEERESVLQKLESIDAKTKEKGEFEANFTEEEERVLKTIRARQMLRKDGLNIDTFSADIIGGFVPNLKRGSLGLVKAIPTAAVKVM